MTMANLWQDLRYAARTIRRAPGFAMLAILTIAIGVGANAAIFSVVNAALFRPLPYPRDDELIVVTNANRTTRQTLGNANAANFLDWRARNRSFTGLAGHRFAAFTLLAGGHPERVAAAMVNANFFDVLEVSPLVGRPFGPDDEGPGAPRVAMLSHAMWRDRFGMRADVVGQQLRLDDELYTVVGVMPRAVEYPDKAELWVPPHWRVPDDPLTPGQDPSSDRNHGYFSVLARLKPGVSFEAAQADLDAVGASLRQDYPTQNQDIGIAQARLRGEMVGDVRSTMLLLFAAVGLLLLIAAANISGLLMARATARHQEIAIRAALGATRGRIVSQLLTESVLLAVAGGAAGVLLAMWLIAPLVALSPSDLAVAGDVTIDGTVLLFGLGISTFAGILFGLAPARQLSRVDVHDDLKQSARNAVGGRQRRMRAVLVAGEIALSLVLLVAAGLTVRSFIRVQQVSTGFDPDRVMTVGISPPATRYKTQAQRAEFWERVLTELQRVPGVERVGATSRLPLLPGNSTRGLTIPDLPDGQPSAGADYRTASPDYFAVMSIPVLRGRAIEVSDREGRPATAVVSQSAAQRFWPARDPIGQHFQIAVPGPEYTVVGVVGDVHAASLEAAPQPTVYVPYRQDAFPFMTFVLRTGAPKATLAAAIREAVWRVDKEQPIGAIRTMDEQLSSSLTRRRFSVTLLTAFGATAVALAAVGLYGVLAFIVSQRRREIGVRIALGATARDVVTDVLGQGMRLAALGMGIGLALALMATRLMRSLLFGTSPTDVATFAGAATLLTVIAVAASLVPAIRASRVDPLKALRDD
jgi:putative ABC transport system permease protein